jgi:cyclic dehypoxanthinyl futalosine synthase
VDLLAAQRAAVVESIADKVERGARLSKEEGVRLFRHPNLPELAALADMRRQALVPGDTVTYVVGRILNYTNVCWVRCKFCAFYRPPGHPEGYLLSDEEILDKVGELVDLGGIEVLFQGGLNPALRIDYFERLFPKILDSYPGVILHALSPTEILYVAHRSRLTLRECIRRLKAAGLHSIPGAGGEILVDRVRERIAPYKETTGEWLACMRTAADLDIRSSATMMFGHVETPEERVEHLVRIRELQDECEPFRAFIAWSFQPEETALSDLRKASSYDYLRTVAVSRLMLDNVPNLQCSILTQGPKIAQISLGYGVNDFGSVMIEENVVSAAGNKFILGSEEIERLISDAGYVPRRRNTRYEVL